VNKLEYVDPAGPEMIRPVCNYDSVRRFVSKEINENYQNNLLFGLIIILRTGRGN